MTQTLLTTGKKRTELERLYIIRKNYYDELLQELEVFKRRKKELIISCNQKFKELDKDIRREKRKINAHHA